MRAGGSNKLDLCSSDVLVQGRCGSIENGLPGLLQVCHAGMSEKQPWTRFTSM